MSGNDLKIASNSNIALANNIPTTYIKAATGESTRRAYQNDIAHFYAWGGVLPTTADKVIAYLHHYANELNVRTLQRRLIALRVWHQSQALLDPTDNILVKKTMAGIIKIHGKPKIKAPILTLEQLTTLAEYFEYQNTLASQRNNALIQTGYFGALRRSELVRIQYEHLNFVPEGVEILIPHSKTDVNRQGATIAIPYSNQFLCAVKALKKWCHSANISSGYLFTKIDRHKNLLHQPLSAQSINIILKEAAKNCRFTNADKFSAHSLRRGFATIASKKGVPFISIMRHGRWKNEKTVLEYIAEGKRFEENAVDIILNSQ